MSCLIGYRNSGRFCLMKVLHQSLGETQGREVKTVPSHLMNFQWSREQKWNWVRVITVSSRTFRRTQFVTSAWRGKLTRAYCSRRTGTVVPRVEHFGDLITADHINLSEESESRNNHWYAVVVQDLATPWIQSCPCKTKTSLETQKKLMKFLGSDEETTSHLHSQFLRICQELSWNHCTSTPHRSETNGIAERAVRRVKDLRCCCSLVWVTNAGRVLWNVTAICETFKISCLMGKHHTRDVLGNHLKDRSWNRWTHLKS